MRLEISSSVRLLEGVEASVQLNTDRSRHAQRTGADTSSFNDMMTESMQQEPRPSRNEHLYTHSVREAAHGRRDDRHDDLPAPAREAHDRRDVKRAELAERKAERHSDRPESATPENGDTEAPSQDSQALPAQENSEADVCASCEVQQKAPGSAEVDSALQDALNTVVSELQPEQTELAAKKNADKPAEQAAHQASQVVLPQQVAEAAKLATQKAHIEIQQAANENAELPAEGVVKETKGKLTAQLARLGADVTAETPAEAKPQTAQPQALAVQAEKAEEKIIKTEIIQNFVEQMQAKADKPVTAPGIGSAQNNASGQIIALPSTAQSFNAHLNAATAAPPQQAQQSAAEVSTMDALPFHVKRAVDQGKDIIELRLDPAELGKIEIRLERGADNRLTAHIMADRPETYQLLQKDASTLIKDMQNAGLDMDSTGMQFSLRQDHQEAQRNGQTALGSLPQFTDQNDDLNEIPQSLIQNAAAYNRLYVPGRVDMRV